MAKHPNDLKLKVLHRGGSTITLLVRMPARVKKFSPLEVKLYENQVAFEILDAANVHLYFNQDCFYVDWGGPAEMCPYADLEEVAAHNAKVKQAASVKVRAAKPAPESEVGR